MTDANTTSVSLQTGAAMPSVGYGTWRCDDGAAASGVRAALEAGYRHIDCAEVYDNQAEIGAVFEEMLNDDGIPRDSVFITSKLWNTNHAAEHVRAACERTLADLKLDYLDLYLVHFPIAFEHTSIEDLDGARDDFWRQKLAFVPISETWKAMEGLVEAGLVKAIGISNFNIPQTCEVLAAATIKPAVNQIETHPYFARQSLVDFSATQGISITAHTPLGGGAANESMFGAANPLNDPVVAEVAEAHGVSAAQVILRWGVQRGTVVIPKSTNADRIAQNIDIFGFELTEGEMNKIGSLDKGAGGRSNNPHIFWGWDPIN